LCFAIALTLSCAASGDKADDSQGKDAIRQQIAKYTAAPDAADIDLASQVWRTSAEVSFIHPMGHARGWEEETAWAEFYWHFAAKQSKDGSVVQTDGRETQIYDKAGNRWQLVHVHYSGPAMAP
jgi:hypothetical protein